MTGRNVLLCAFTVVLVAIGGCHTDQTTVLLTRHAEKTIDSQNPGLTETGHARAQALAQLAQSEGVDVVVSTQLRRTIETAAPAAETIGTSIDIVPVASPVNRHIAIVVELIQSRYAGHTVLVVGHSNTIPLLVSALGGPAVQIKDSDYGDVFILTLRDGEAVDFERTRVDP